MRALYPKHLNRAFWRPKSGGEQSVTSVQVGTTRIERGVLLVSIAQSAMWLSCLTTSIYSRRRLRKRRERSENHRLRHRVLAACY